MTRQEGEKELTKEEMIDASYARIDGVLAQLKISRGEHDLLKSDLDFLAGEAKSSKEIDEDK